MNNAFDVASFHYAESGSLRLIGSHFHLLLSVVLFHETTFACVKHVVRAVVQEAEKLVILNGAAC